MEEERVYNEMSSYHNVTGGSAAAAGAVHAASVHRTRTVSSPVPVNVRTYLFYWQIKNKPINFYVSTYFIYNTIFQF